MNRLSPWAFLLVLGFSACAPEVSTPLTQGDFAEPPVIITEPGRFVFTEDIVIRRHHVNAIEVRADNVTIDLNGFRLRGPGQAAGHGIYQPPNRKHLTLAGGTINGWYGIRSFAVRAEGAGNSLKRLHVTDSEGGIWCGDEAVITECHVEDIDSVHDGYGIRTGNQSIISNSRVNGVHSRGAIGYGIFAGNESTIRYAVTTGVHSEGHMGYGIRVGRQSMIVDSSAVSNIAKNIGYGIASGAGSRISSSRAEDNRADGDGYGIAGGHDSVLDKCVARNNLANGRYGFGIHGGNATVIQYSQAEGNAGNAHTLAGLAVGAEGRIRKSESIQNRMHGIWLGSPNARALENVVDGNGHEAGGAGILVTSYEAAVENNTVVQNAIGIRATGTMNEIRHNTVRDNDTNYDIAPGNTLE